MAVSPPWIFAQLGGARKTLGLSGWQAPFGRPRNGTLVNAGLAMRTSTTYYPGGAGVEPTVHSFGPKPKPWEMHGRFMDLAITGGLDAMSLRRAWYDFVADGQVVRATWGAFLSYRMFIEEIDLDIEASTDIAWQLKAIVFADESAAIVTTITAPQAPFDMASRLKDGLDVVNAFTPSGSLTDSIKNLLNIFPEFADLLDTAIAQINEPFGSIFDICSALSDFESALTSDLGKIGAGLQAMQTGIIDLRDATGVLEDRAAQFDDPSVDSPLGIFSGPDTIERAAQKIAADRATANLLALIADMRNEVDRALYGRAQSAHVAQTGDSWESLSRRTLGSTSGTRALRALNAAKYGTQPRAGSTIKLPRTG